MTPVLFSYSIRQTVNMATCDECCGFNLKDVESYVKKHDIHYILKDCIIKLCASRPDNPYRFMREYFENLEKVCNLHDVIYLYSFIFEYSPEYSPDEATPTAELISC